MNWLERERAELDNSMQVFASIICDRTPDTVEAQQAFEAWVEPFLAWRTEEARELFEKLKPHLT